MNSDPTPNPEKPVEQWVTGEEPMTGPQLSYLQTLCREAGEEFNDQLTKAEASQKIEELQAKTGRGKAEPKLQRPDSEVGLRRKVQTLRKLRFLQMSATFLEPVDLKLPIPQLFYDLAPLDLRNGRKIRYKADGHFVPLGRLAPADRDNIRSLYSVLDDLVARLTSAETSDAQKLRDVLRWMERHRIDDLVEQAQALGRASLADNADQQIAKAMHDIRGGALTGLLGYLQILPGDPHGTDKLSNLYRLGRDEMKIMRSAITGLDDTRRAKDALPRSHDVQLMLGKWQAVVVGPQVNYRSQPVRMFVDCRHEGAITECCLESAAIDRIFYNLTSNACRHAATDRIELSVFHVPDEDGPNLRFILSNVVNEEQVARLEGLAQRTPEKDFRALFDAGVSSMGSGYGMAVVADFVAGAFGLGSPEAAVAQGYTGACLHGSDFRVWFHWPVARNDLQVKTDDHHHPG